LLLEGDLQLQRILTTRPAPLASEEELCLVHDQLYVQKIFMGMLDDQQQRAVGFPWSPALVDRSRASTGGTVAAMHAVMQGSRRMVAANIAGGTHHAFAGHGEGFCKKYLVAFLLLLSLKLLPNFFIHVDVTTEVYMLHQLIENVRGKQNSSSSICKHQLENCKHLGSLT
jgi:hypothetical protein